MYCVSQYVLLIFPIFLLWLELDEHVLVPTVLLHCIDSVGWMAERAETCWCKIVCRFCSVKRHISSLGGKSRAVINKPKVVVVVV